MFYILLDNYQDVLYGTSDEVKLAHDEVCLLHQPVHLLSRAQTSTVEKLFSFQAITLFRGKRGSHMTPAAAYASTVSSFLYFGTAN